MKRNILQSTNPAKNSEIIGSVIISSKKEIVEKIQLAQRVKTSWKEIGVKKRIELLRTLYDALVAQRDQIASMGTLEVGKPITESYAEFDFYIGYFKWFLDNGERVLTDKTTYEDEKTLHKIVYEPIGVAAVITPWNFPFGMFCWGITPNLVAGNPVIWKTSKECPLTGKIIEDIVKSIRLPVGGFSEIYGSSTEGDILVHSDIDFIWFTGSTNVGRKLYQIAAKKHIRCVFELGGSNPAIVFDDVDMEKVISKIYAKKYKNCGQTCDALKRLIVHESIFDVLKNRLRLELETKKVGDPTDTKTDFGPLVSHVQLELLESQVNDAKDKGATIEIGGSPPQDLPGPYFLPTLLTNIKPTMRVWKEEVFGPVLTMIPFTTEEEAIQLANDNEYGLGSIVFTKDKKRAIRVALKLDTGTVEINSGMHWLACNPFGGYKHSGIGREHGEEGLKELSQIKVISMEK
jgi:succinate-semialdehyde dehydrogenase / glutarate-semialdehyde dehydrogenase